MKPHLCVGWWGPSQGPWEWIQSQFERTTLVNRQTVDHWLNGSREREDCSRRVVLIGIEHRSDREPLAWLEQRLLSDKSSQEKFSTNPPLGILLGNDWHGHRRTHPLPEGIPTFYWYQWYDRIFPWLSEVIATDLQEVAGTPKTKRSSHRRKEATLSQSLPNESVPWRIQWAMERTSWQSSMLSNCHQDRNSHQDQDHPLAWVITDHRSQSEMWQDSCQSVGMRVVASRWDRDPPSLQPQLIVVDCVSRHLGPELVCDPSNSEESIESVAQRARKQHPEAFLAVVSPFPAWSEWSKWQQLGVDAVLPRPSAVQGFLFYWKQWRSRAAA
jgi:hypothetical protein